MFSVFNLPIYMEFGVVMAGTSTGEHFLGHPSVWRVPKIIPKNIYIAFQHVVYVYCGYCSPYDIIRASQVNIQLQSPRPVITRRNKKKRFAKSLSGNRVKQEFINN